MSSLAETESSALGEAVLSGAVGSGPGPDPNHIASARARVGLAAATLPLAWPIDRWVAVNPLSRCEDLAVEEVGGFAAAHLGAAGAVDEARMRDLFSAGRITEHDLCAAMAARLPQLARATVVLDGLAIDGTDLAIVDLTTGSVATPAAMRPVLLSERVDAAHGSARAAELDAEVARWCSAYLDESSHWPMPGRELGLYRAWQRLVPSDWALRRLVGRHGRRVLASLPTEPVAAVEQLLVPIADNGADAVTDNLERAMWRLPGWSAALVHRDGPAGDDVVGFVAIRLALEAAFAASVGAPALAALAGDGPDEPAEPAGPTPEERAGAVLRELGVRADHVSIAEVAAVLAAVTVVERTAIWQEALEAGYRSGLLDALDHRPVPVDATAPGRGERVRFQVVTCIDPRSEGLRRQLEARLGPLVETLGFAGFFGLPVSLRGLDEEAPAASCPVVLQPRADIEEVAGTAELERRLRGRTARGALRHAWADSKSGAPTAFGLAELAGWVSGPVAVASTLAPVSSGRLRRRLGRAFTPAIASRMEIGQAPSAGGRGPAPLTGLSADDQVALARSILVTMGLTSDFGRIVLLCGHGSDHVNNPFRAANDCGACGGRSGADNARVAAALLNAEVVRDGLARAGIPVPADTLFVAGEHETTTDVVALLDADALPGSHQRDLTLLLDALSGAGAALAVERAAALPGPVGAPAPRTAGEVRRRADDWAQVVPEWGLVNNAALIVGPRALTRGVDLGRRAFLHSYDAGADTDGAVLEAVMTGPLVVAHWISAQYFASTVDPRRFGAGAKPLHNVVGTLGVLEGPGGDLRLGLPAESVSARGVPVHEPMRLLVVVDAPAARVDRVLGANPAVARLVRNGWVRLVARGDGGRSWAERSRAGAWLEPSTTDDPVDGDDHPGGSPIVLHDRQPVDLDDQQEARA